MVYRSVVLRADRKPRLPLRPGACALYQYPNLSIETRARPVPGPGEVLLAICQTAICGTDVHVMQTDEEGFCRSSVPAAGLEQGIQFGHEFAGKVVGMGPGVENLELGAYVTSDSLVPCRSRDCRACRNRQWNVCPRAYLLGLQADGAFGEFAVVPAASLHPILPLIHRYGLAKALRVAPLSEPLGVVLHAFNQALRWLRDDSGSALILGAGPIGLFFAWKARLAGMDPVVVLEPNPQRALLARLFAHHVLHPDDFDAAFVRQVFGEGPSVMFEACGHASIDNLLTHLAPGGALVTVARTGQQLGFASDTLITRGQAVIGARGHVGCVRDAVNLLAGSAVDPEMFITRSLNGLDDLALALQRPDNLAHELKVVCRVA